MESLIWILIIAGAAGAGFMAYRSSIEDSREARTIKSLPPSVQHVVAQMDGGSQAAFFNEYDRSRKKKAIGYVLWFFLGWHYLYARRVGLQFAFWFTGGALGVWWLVDLFRMPVIIRNVNEQIAREVLQTLHIGAAFARIPVPDLMIHSGGVPVTTGASRSGHPAPVQIAAPDPNSAGTGWFPDPTGRHAHRWFDGAGWTTTVTDGGATGHDPL